MGDTKDSHFWDSLLTFVAGAATGFIVGILVAPASGKETRKKIKDQAAKTGEAAKEGYEKITKEAEKGIRMVKEKTGEGVDAIRDFIEKKREEFCRRPRRRSRPSDRPVRRGRRREVFLTAARSPAMRNQRTMNHQIPLYLRRPRHRRSGRAAPRGPAGRPKTARRIDAEIEKNKAEIVKIRRFIHMNPELGNREVETARLIAARLQPLGFEVRTGVAKTGIVAVLRGGQAGPAVAIRADMDALPVQETTGPPLQIP